MNKLVILFAPLLAFAFASPAQAQLTWVESPVNGHWYAKSQAMLWHDAEQVATDLGGHLATIRSQAENDWAYAEFGNGFWIGLNDEALPDTWVWSSGEPVVYTNWAGGQPDFANQHWVWFWETQAGQWDDYVLLPVPGLIELVSDDCNANGEPDVWEIYVDPMLDPNANGVLEACESSVTTYCSPASANTVSSTGAKFSVSGTPSTLINDLRFAVTDLPVDMPGVFFYGPFQNQVPFGNGTVCVGGSVNRVLPALWADANGSVTLDVDLSQPPFASGAGTVLPGSTWDFQYWYRDPTGFPATFNLSDAAEIVFAP